MQSIPDIERSNLVAFGECRIIEAVFDKVIDGSTKVQDGLPDVNELAGALADDMYTQKLPRAALTDHL